MLGRLAGAFEVTAIDMRGHGRSGLPADPARLRNWDIYGNDVAAVLEPFDDAAKRPFFLAGHSFGAVAATLAASGRHDVAGLALIEPVAIPPLLSAAAGFPFASALIGLNPLVRNARSRRANWPDRQAVRDSYVKKPLFQAWAPGVLDDYLEDGLTADEQGVSLACAPAWEAATFAAQSQRFWPAVRRAPGPTAVLAADHPGSTVFGDSATRFRRLGASVEVAAGVSHLAPMENPAAAADFVRRAAARAGLAR
jgi:pimeloyl-ACP methyl ester carboxylesterase